MSVSAISGGSPDVSSLRAQLQAASAHSASDSAKTAETKSAKASSARIDADGDTDGDKVADGSNEKGSGSSSAKLSSGTVASLLSAQEHSQANTSSSVLASTYYQSVGNGTAGITG